MMPTARSKPANGSLLLFDFVCESLCSSVRLCILIANNCSLIGLSVECGFHFLEGNHDVPYRALMPLNVDNLLVAGIIKGVRRWIPNLSLRWLTQHISHFRF